MLHSRLFSYLLVPLLLPFIIGSNPKKNTVKNSPIVLIFDQNPAAVEPKQGLFYTPNQVRYYGSDLIRNEIVIHHKTKVDTVKISTAQNTLPIDLFYNYIVFNYHFKPGDTVNFTFKDNIPYVSKINRRTKALDLNYTLALKKRFNEQLIGDNFVSLGKPEPIEKVFASLYNRYRNYKQYTDSLYKASLLAPDLYQTYSQQFTCSFLGGVIFNQKFDSLLQTIPERFSIEETVNNESLLYNDFFLQFLAWRYLWSDQLAVPKINKTQSRTIDYKVAYDKIKTTIQNEPIKNYLLFFCLQKIFDEDSNSNFKTYLAKFKIDVNDPRFANYLKNSFDDYLLQTNGSTVLTNISKSKKIEFSALLNSFKGNVVYVDLWASWCAPCRAAMPASRALKAAYAGKKIKFLYISMDTQFANWTKAATEEQLKNDPNSLLMLNSKNAALPKQLGISAIPRYLIYNKKGQLVYQNAPGPDGTEIKAILNKYLMQ